MTSIDRNGLEVVVADVRYSVLVALANWRASSARPSFGVGCLL
jgi:hypothetical protein